MHIPHDLQRAIRRLSRFDREALAEWMADLGDVGDRVAEAAPAYGAAPEQPLLSVDEYLKFEEESPIRHEYLGGRIFAMSGPKVRHGVIVRNLVVSFASHLKTGPCQVFSTDIKAKLKADEEDIFYYPDVSVVCGPQNMDSQYLTNPRLIVEVLSPSTERYDRYEKARNYRGIASLEEYVLVAQRKPEVTIHRRGDHWAPVILRSLTDVAEFRALGMTIILESIYQGTQ